jgi:hypothetical protein
MGDTVTIIPAFGKKYNTKYEVMKDWQKGVDFRISGGSYCSTRDLKALMDDYDRVILHWIDEVGKENSYTLWEHVLRGLTTYV